MPWVPTIVSHVTTVSMELDVHLIMEVVVVAVEVTAPSCEVEPDIHIWRVNHVVNCCINIVYYLPPLYFLLVCITQTPKHFCIFCV